MPTLSSAEKDQKKTLLLNNAASDKSGQRHPSYGLVGLHATSAYTQNNSAPVENPTKSNGYQKRAGAAYADPSFAMVTSSSGSSLVSIGGYSLVSPDDSTWVRARYLLLVYLAAATILAVLSRVWPMVSSPSLGPLNAAQETNPPTVEVVFDPRIEETRQYEQFIANTGGDGPRGLRGRTFDGESGVEVGGGGPWWAVTILCLCLALKLVSGLWIARQPQNTVALYSRTPYVPLVPLLAVSINSVLIAALPALAWLRFAASILPGLLIYCFYSQRHSKHRQEDEQEVVLFDISQLPATQAGATGTT